MAVAVFDVDNTLIRGTTTLPAVVALVRAGVIEPAGLTKAVWEQFRFRLSNFEPDVAELRNRGLAAIKGVDFSLIENVLDGVADRLVDRYLYPGSRRLLAEHLDRGDQVWLATAGPAALAARLADRLGVDGALGTEVEVLDGRCTGELAGPFLHGEEKASALETLAAKLGWDISSVHAYTDSIRDLPLLRLVGMPNAVNPDGSLFKLATDMGWPVHNTGQKRKSVRGATAAISSLGTLGASFGRRREG